MPVAIGLCGRPCDVPRSLLEGLSRICAAVALHSAFATICVFLQSLAMLIACRVMGERDSVSALCS